MINIPVAEMIERTKLIVDKTNPNVMDSKNFEALKDVIKKFGFIIPIITNKDLVIADGYHRYKAARELGIETVPVIALDVDEVDRRILRQILNKLKGTHADELDAEEFKFLDDSGAIVELMSFLPKEMNEIKRIVDELQLDNADEEEDFDIETAYDTAKKNTTIAKGDTFNLGKHKLMCGDSTDVDQVNSLVEGKADMIFTDPPYGVNYSGGTRFKKGGVVEMEHREKLINDESPEIYDLYIPIMAEITNGPIYTWFGTSKAINIFQAVAEVGEIHSIIVWVKGGGSGDLNSNYKHKYEMCMYWKPKDGKLNFAGPTNEGNLWEIQKDGVNKHHPTQKPVELAARAIKNSSQKDGIVLDLFGGSGSTLIACEQLNRKCRMMELDPVYCQVIIDRWEKYAGGKAEKL